MTVISSYVSLSKLRSLIVFFLTRLCRLIIVGPCCLLCIRWIIHLIMYNMRNMKCISCITKWHALSMYNTMYNFLLILYITMYTYPYMCNQYYLTQWYPNVIYSSDNNMTLPIPTLTFPYSRRCVCNINIFVTTGRSEVAKKNCGWKLNPRIW